MGGVIAAGSSVTANVGAQILERGGNAVSAVTAACFAVSAGEPSIASLAGGGVMLIYQKDKDEVSAYDFFANMPGLGAGGLKNIDFNEVLVDFGPTKQSFHVGKGAAAFGGLLPGICQAAQKYANFPLKDLVSPSIELLRKGAKISAGQAKAMKLLEPILKYTKKGSDIFAPHGKLLGENDKYKNLQLAEHLEILVDDGFESFYNNTFLPSIFRDFSPKNGGLITEKDHTCYEVLRSKPLSLSYRGTEIYTAPRPSAGGELIFLSLKLLETFDENEIKGEKQRVLVLARIMKVVEEIRHFFPDAVLEDKTYDWGVKRLKDLKDQVLSNSPVTPSGASSTTHISCLDDRGNAAALTFTYGFGCGHMIGDTGIMMNNLLGESDLSPRGFHQHELGQRLNTMMAPTFCFDKEKTVVLGSGGANRIRTAIFQVLSNLLDQKLSCYDAVKDDRIHYESGRLSFESVGSKKGLKDYIKSLGSKEVLAFDEPNLFFGGVHLVENNKLSGFQGIGDPRRGGLCLVV